jgi:hypothetical protein
MSRAARAVESKAVAVVRIEHRSRRQPTPLPGLRCGARLARRASPPRRPTPVVRCAGGVGAHPPVPLLNFFWGASKHAHRVGCAWLWVISAWPPCAATRSRQALLRKSFFKTLFGACVPSPLSGPSENPTGFTSGGSAASKANRSVCWICSSNPKPAPSSSCRSLLVSSSPVIARGDHFFPGTPGGCFGWLRACLGVGAATTPRELEGGFPRLAPASLLGATSTGSQKGLEAVCLDSL